MHVSENVILSEIVQTGWTRSVVRFVVEMANLPATRLDNVWTLPLSATDKMIVRTARMRIKIAVKNNKLTVSFYP